jgi:Tol biopolymer transport system component
LLQLPEDQYDARLSPDGRWLAYGSNESDEEHVYVTSFPELRGRWQVSIEDGDRPRWNDDGTKIYYLSNQDEIMEASVDGVGSAFRVGEITKLFKIENASRPGRIYDISGDEQTILLNVRPGSQTSTSLVLVQNWPAEFEK